VIRVNPVNVLHSTTSFHLPQEVNLLRSFFWLVERSDDSLRFLLGTLGHESSILVATLIRQGGSVLELPSRDLALVKLVKLPIGAAVSLVIISTQISRSRGEHRRLTSG